MPSLDSTTAHTHTRTQFRRLLNAQQQEFTGYSFVSTVPPPTHTSPNPCSPGLLGGVFASSAFAKIQLVFVKILQKFK